jgi:hypothetical protein
MPFQFEALLNYKGDVSSGLYEGMLMGPGRANHIFAVISWVVRKPSEIRCDCMEEHYGQREFDTHAPECEVSAFPDGKTIVYLRYATEEDFMAHRAMIENQEVVVVGGR